MKSPWQELQNWNNGSSITKSSVPLSVRKHRNSCIRNYYCIHRTLSRREKSTMAGKELTTKFVPECRFWKMNSAWREVSYGNLFHFFFCPRCRRFIHPRLILHILPYFKTMYISKSVFEILFRYPRRFYSCVFLCHWAKFCIEARQGESSKVFWKFFKIEKLT